VIEDNTFGFACPSKASPAGYIRVAGTANGHVARNTFCVSDTAITTSNTLSNLVYGMDGSNTGVFGD
jgi:hypothetical protein